MEIHLTFLKLLQTDRQIDDRIGMFLQRDCAKNETNGSLSDAKGVEVQT